MAWLVLSYSLPGVSRSSPRVAIWRRLKRLGVLPMAGGASVLPARDACAEAFQWLAQEIRQAEGEALIMRVDQFDGLSDAHLIARFQQARGKDYGELEAQVAALEQELMAQPAPDQHSYHDALDRLRRRYTDLARVDYFDCPAGARIAARLARIAHRLAGGPAAASLPSASRADYRNRRWVTRPRPHVDRLACAWLIRRFIDPGATIRYADAPEPGEVAFDMPDVAFGHQGDRCSFETLIQAFGLDDPGLYPLAEIVHEIDLRDGRYARPEVAGVDAILSGWRLADQPDSVLESQGMALFEGLYTTSLHQPVNAPILSPVRRPAE